MTFQNPVVLGSKAMGFRPPANIIATTLTVMVLHVYRKRFGKRLRKANTRFGSVLKMIPIEVQKIGKDFKITRLFEGCNLDAFLKSEVDPSLKQKRLSLL